MNASELQRFEDKYCPEPNSGCWLWTGGGSRGYGYFWLRGRWRSTHRIAFEHYRGPVPEGLQLDHLCKTPACCNPDHLEPVLQRVNLLRGRGFAAINASATHCANGHSYTVDNTIVSKKTGWRRCRACTRIQKARSYAAKKARPS